MKTKAEELYSTLCDAKLKKLTDLFQDGFTGMYVVLKILNDAPKELTAGDISEEFGVTTARTAVVLNTLEKKGFVNKSKSKIDARKTIVNLTQKGKQALNERKNKIVAIIDKFVSKLRDTEFDTFHNIVKKFLSV